MLLTYGGVGRAVAIRIGGSRVVARLNGASIVVRWTRTLLSYVK